MTELCSRTERFEQLYYFLFISLFDVFTNADDPVSAHERETFDALGEADEIGSPTIVVENHAPETTLLHRKMSTSHQGTRI
mmetsp:Transcript_536/g.1006  ORF Transcript_536/g.1006 Transcript_536/m.1006 type:complete len:81 (+) Transcript_536:136-378(+)